jgi:hypothetical protein
MCVALMVRTWLVGLATIAARVTMSTPVTLDPFRQDIGL